MIDVVTLDEFIADIETTFSKYAATNDIDRNSLKGWVIECLRKFGKNICDTRETVLKVENSRVVLPESFRSMIVGLRLFDESAKKENQDKRLIVEKQKIENPAYWSDTTMDYFVNYCESKITTEKIYTYYQHEQRCYDYQWLVVNKGINKDTIATNCLNLNPLIQGNFENRVSITKRTMNTQFKTGLVYIQYTSLPADEKGEIVIPIISTGSIKEYIENTIKIKICEDLIINDKNPQALIQLMGKWEQKDRKLYIEACSESNWSGFSPKWYLNIYKKNRENQNLYTLPRK